MKAGIFAAGSGSRFLEAGWQEPKPLVRINRKPLLAHLLDSLFLAGVEHVEILLNAQPRFDAVEDFIRQHDRASRIGISRKTTESSYESFLLVMNRMGSPPYLMSTVDTIFSAEELKGLLDLSQYPPSCSLVLAVTGFSGDTKPLWVDLSEEGGVRRIGQSASTRDVVTAGLYLVLRDLPRPHPGEPIAALRTYLEYVVNRQICVWAKKFDWALDIDLPEDVQMAESLL